MPDHSNAANRIMWTNISQWKKEQQELGYPRPQGNVPMFLALREPKRRQLLHQYMSVLNSQE